MATTSRGLGKGLSALISENYVQPVSTAKPEAVQEEGRTGVTSLSIQKLHAGKYQPRTQFDQQALTDLANSISKNGIMQPIIVRASDKQGGKYEIIAGERRWRAATQAGLNEVPVIIREIDDLQALELALVENIQRQDLTPLEEAAGYQRLIDEFNYTQEVLATAIGKSRSHVANILRLLSLPGEVKEMLDRGEITMGHARALLATPNPVDLARDIISKGFNVRQAEQASREAQGREKKTNSRNSGQSQPQYNNRPQVNKDPDILALEDSLSENLGVRVSINDRGQSGEIVLAYDSLSQLDDILRRLGDNI